MQTPTSATETPERIHRECHCPPWVTRCVHLSDSILVLEDDAIMGGCIDYRIPEKSRYAVYELDEFCPCPHCGELCGGPDGEPFETANYDIALAAFHAAEEALLRGAE